MEESSQVDLYLQHSWHCLPTGAGAQTRSCLSWVSAVKFSGVGILQWSIVVGAGNRDQSIITHTLLYGAHWPPIPHPSYCLKMIACSGWFDWWLNSSVWPSYAFLKVNFNQFLLRILWLLPHFSKPELGWNGMPRGGAYAWAFAKGQRHLKL